MGLKAPRGGFSKMLPLGVSVRAFQEKINQRETCPEHGQYYLASYRPEWKKWGKAKTKNKIPAGADSMT